ncbi:MAG: hypothetical protein AB8B48_11120 [Pseudomonadales bacterium]
MNVPGPWSEAAKAVFRLRKVDYLAVGQVAGGENEELVAWTNHRNAPIALYNDEAPRVRCLEIVELAQRLGSGPELLPNDIGERMEVVALVNEIGGESGFAWHGRLVMLKPGHDAKGDAILATPLYRDYGYTPQAAATAITRVQEILDMLSTRIATQKSAGSPYLVGNAISAADVYWAYFSQMLEAMPPEQNPMPDFLRKSWGFVAQALGEYDPVLIEHRNYIFNEHLELPLQF